MPVQIIKQLAVVEDLELGLGTVVQPRDTDGDGIPEDVTYNQINASHIPTTGLGDTQQDLDDRYTKGVADTTFAKIAGDPLQVFSVEDPSTLDQAVPRGYLETYTANQLSSYALITDVLTKTNLIAYEPTSDYHPGTKKYMDDLIIASGTGDMLKLIYDNLDNGVVNEARLLGGLSKDAFMQYKGTATQVISTTALGYYYCDGTDFDLPAPTQGMLNVYDVPVGPGYTVQEYTVIPTNEKFIRSWDGTAWQAWESTYNDIYIVDDLLGDSNPYAALSADQGKVLANQVSAISSLLVPIGTIIMYYGPMNGPSMPSLSQWAVCDGNNGTPDLRNRFAVMNESSDIGVGDIYKFGDKQGSSAVPEQAIKLVFLMRIA